MRREEWASARVNRQTQRLMDALTDCSLYILDPDGIIQTWNTGAQRIKGYADHEVIGSSFSRFFTPEDQAKGRPAEMLRLARAHGTYAGEGWRVRKDGSRLWASVILDPIWNDQHRPTGFIQITRDTTERHFAIKALQESEERFRRLLHNVTQYAIYTLDPDGVVTSWSPGAERTHGYAQDEILGRNFSIFFTPEDVSDGRPAEELSQARSGARFEGEGWRVRKDGTRFWVNAVIDPMRDEAGRLIGFSKVSRDITEKHAIDLARERSLQAQRMEMVGRLAGGIAHDFNNILTVILSGLELMARPTCEREDLGRLADAGRRAAQRGSALTAQLLSYARQQVLRPERANVNAILGQLRQGFASNTESGLLLATDFAREIWMTEIDPLQFSAAVMNLIVNAKEALDGPGEIRIETRNEVVGPDREAARQLIPPGDYVCVTVRDTGMGMDERTLSKAAEPFFSTKQGGGNSGLGLSQVQGFVAQSNGSVRIVSAPRQGSAVTLYLPRSDPAEPARRREGPDAGAASSGAVLVVDDDLDVLVTTSAAVESLGYPVVRARGGAEAMSALRSDRPISLVFADIVMGGGMTGVELAQEAARLDPGIKVLLTSGYSRDVLEANESVADGLLFIGKPYDLSTLSALMRSLVAAPAPRH